MYVLYLICLRPDHPKAVVLDIAAEPPAAPWEPGVPALEANILHFHDYQE